MPRHDYRCPSCAGQLRDIVRSIGVGAQADPPLCPECQLPMEWIPSVGRMDAYEPFQEFDQVIDQRGTTVHIDSLRKLRQVEKAAEQRAKDGTGQPLVWRDYSQDHSNQDVHTLLPFPDQSVRKTTHRGEPFTKRVGDEVARDHDYPDLDQVQAVRASLKE